MYVLFGIFVFGVRDGVQSSPVVLAYSSYGGLLQVRAIRYLSSTFYAVLVVPRRRLAVPLPVLAYSTASWPSSSTRFLVFAMACGGA